MGTTVLVVDDEPTSARSSSATSSARATERSRPADGDAARQLLESEQPDLVVLDVMLPGTDGLALCRWIRSRSSLPVIMLTARGEEADRIVGLELGADDYVTKPFSPRELAARVRTVLRRVDAAVAQRRARSRSGISSSTRPRARCARRASALKLTAKEFDLLWFLASHPTRSSRATS